MIQSIFVHLLKQNTRQFNSWLLLLEKHGVLEANVHKTSFLFSAFSHCMSCQWEPENPRFIIPGPLIYTGLLKQPAKIYMLSVPPMYNPAHQRLQETRTSEMNGPCSVQISNVVSKFRHNYFHFHSPTEVTMLTGRVEESPVLVPRTRQQYLQ